MIRLKVRTAKHDTVTTLYGDIGQVVESIATAGVDRRQAVLVAHREVFAYVGMHGTGQRFAVWRSTDQEEALTDHV